MWQGRLYQTSCLWLQCKQSIDSENGIWAGGRKNQNWVLGPSGERLSSLFLCFLWNEGFWDLLGTYPPANLFFFTNFHKCFTNFHKFCETLWKSCECTLLASFKTSFHRKHKNSDGNQPPLGPVSQFWFFRSGAQISVPESIDSLHCSYYETYPLR